MPEVLHPALQKLADDGLVFNLPDRQISGPEIASIRENTRAEVERALSEIYPRVDFEAPQHIDSDADEDDGTESFPFGEAVVEMKEEEEVRIEAMKKQMEVSLRYLDQMLEIDAEVCGNDVELGMQLPIQRVRKKGRDNIVVTTNNSWGSTDYTDPDLQEKLRDQFTGMDADENMHFGQQGYEDALRSFLSIPRDRSTDMPVLNEEDRVDIFDKRGNFVGRAVVRDVAGDEILLRVHSKITPRKGFVMRKKSNERALQTYRRHVYDFCKKLSIHDQITDKNGDPYEWGYDEDEEDERDRYDDESVSDRLSLVERSFFGIESDSYNDEVRGQVASRNFDITQVPRSIIDDAEQCVAFGMGAMGVPCYLVQGPPGTGKTTVASHLSKHLQKQGLKTLILSHSNKGLDNLLLEAKKNGVAVNRGGTESNVCARDLHDEFIRRDLHYPRRADFLEVRVDTEAFDGAKKEYADAQAEEEPEKDDFMEDGQVNLVWYQEAIAARKRRQEKPEPTEEDFTKPILDKVAWKAAWKEFDGEKQKIVDVLSREKGLVAGVTLNSLISDEIIQALDFDVVIVDEASKGYIFELLPALKKAGKQIIFVGDHKQLGNIDIPTHLKKFLEDNEGNLPEDAEFVRIGEGEVDGFDSGPFEFMAEHTSIPQVMLRTNRRSLPAIVELVSKAGYDGKLKAGRIDHKNPENIGKLVWVDTSSRSDRFEHRSGVSRINHLEARLAARRLFREYMRGNITEGDLGVITMYRAQGRNVLRKAEKMTVEEGQREAHEAFIKLLRSSIATVDAFQGSEKNDIVELNTRSNTHEEIGFLENVRRPNVACSRARNTLVIYGDKSTLIDNNPDEESRSFFAAAYEVCEKRGTIVSEFPSLPRSAMAEEDKVQTPNANRARARRRWRREQRQSQN